MRGEGLSVWVSATAGDYQRFLLRIKELEEKVAELEKENAEQAKLIAELRAKLAQYENPHTPSSAQRFKDEAKPSGSKKRGAPKGHRGATRPKPEPDEVVEVTAEHCEACGSRDLEEEGVEATVIEDIPPPPKIKVIQYNRHKYRCRTCGHTFEAAHGECPTEGRFGVNLLVYLSMLKFNLRGVLRRIGDFMGHVTALSITPKGIQDALLRVGAACKNEYARSLQRIRAAPWLYVDETSMRVLGKNWWLWSFRTPQGEALVVIRPSRGREVLEEILGTEITCAGVTDGWRAYNFFTVLQRCWSHLIREVDAFQEKPGGTELSESIHERYRALKEYLGKDPPASMEDRKEQKDVWDREMAELVEHFSQFKELKKPITYIRNGLGDWYTCLLYPGMEPTNNLSEQVIREHVLMRKIIGTFRSAKGAEYYQYIASLIATWRLQGMDSYNELQKLLAHELCLQ